ncbi:dehydrogenase/reductase SDR family member 11-like [Acanthaster planci]|uniref:Dehydrogenase/reductase SDR family member 11-like n=1 Tax=Acanthaster planci TaxID=133434 RepID=A0A8B7XZP6_ACAPL|nr:dehydrogenase/reductase SDR family member 11-like [Acanthaster planci]
MNSHDVSMKRWAGRVALVTGASSGIGWEIARNLVQHGMKVIGCARNVVAIEEESTLLKESQSPGLLYPIKCDLSQEKDILAMFDVIWKKFGGVDVCINNAGLSQAASLLDGDTKKWKNMVDVNILAVAICTREAVKQMAQKGADDGQVININSLSGHKVTQNRDSHFYTATKFAMTSMTEGVRQELREIGSMIRIASISPGIVETEFLSRMYPDNPSNPAALYKSMQCIQPEQISTTVQYIMELPPHVQVHDVQIRPTEQRN